LALLLSLGGSAHAGTNIELAADAPDRYIVVPGDTLWAISGRFLKDPWRWPELWGMNREQIRNPHRIYPGDVLVLDRANGRLQVAKPIKLAPRVYEETIRKEVPSIPPNVIDPFLSEPLVIDAGTLDSSARIVATQEGRVMTGRGDYVFVSGAKESKARLWQVYRPGKDLKDPVSGEVLGQEVLYLGTAKRVGRGDPVRFDIVSAKQEIGRDDWVVPFEQPPLVPYSPRRPETVIDGRLMSVYGTVDTGGQYTIVTINKGSRDGLAIGHVLALSRAGQVAKHNDAAGEKTETLLPDTRYGLAFVFRAFEKVAYALVMSADRPLAIGDAARNP
jgi:hypothetical protein